MKHSLAMLLSAVLAAAFTNPIHAADSEKIQLTITGGHETDPRDHGRPVVLIASALRVTPEVFREAFAHVKPAPGGSHPDPEQVQRNKSALLDALSPYGVTNELLDRVSDYYRYHPGSSRLWPTTSATALVTIKNGAITSFDIVRAGAGYTSPPKISVPGHPEITLKASLTFGRDLKTNGSLKSVDPRVAP